MATVTIAERIRKDGKKSYVIHFVEPKTGKKTYYGTVRKKADANAIANELRSRIDRGLPIVALNKKNTGNVLADLAAVLREQWNQRVQSGDLSVVTHEGYQYFLEPLVRKWGQQAISSITINDILEYRSRVAAENSSCLSNRRLFVLKQIFKVAIEQGIQGCVDIGSIRYLSEKDHQRNRFLMPVELDALIEAARQTRGKYYLPLAVLLGAEHGTSLQEVTSLKWKDIHLLGSGRAFIHFERTKNDSERTQLMMPRALDELLKWKVHLEKRRIKRNIEVQDSYVICHLDGTKMHDFDTSWERACQIAGIEDFTFHDLRHCYCSNILISGGTLKDAKEMIGHKTLKMTDRYSHLESMREQAVQLKLAAHYAGTD